MQSITLYKTSPSGKELYWTCKIDGLQLKIEYGQVGGKILSNIVSCSSIEEVHQSYKTRVEHKMHREGYHEGTPPERLFPMLATPFDTILPCNIPSTIAIQPKIDGIRCLATNDGLYSRADSKITSTPHIQLACNLPPETILDGELYVPSLDFDQQLEYINRDNPHHFWMKIEYHVFDILQEDGISLIDKPFNVRHSRINHLAGSWNSKFVKKVQTCLISRDSIPVYHENFVEQGFEGSIIRLVDGLYEPGVRSKSLFKHKNEYDCPADIINIIKGIDGKEENCAIFICKLENGTIVKARPKLPLDKRRMIYRNKEYYLENPHYTEIRHYGVNKSGQLRQPRAYGISRTKI